MELSYKKQRKYKSKSYVSIVTLHCHKIKVGLRKSSEKALQELTEIHVVIKPLLGFLVRG